MQVHRQGFKVGWDLMLCSVMRWDQRVCPKVGLGPCLGFHIRWDPQTMLHDWVDSLAELPDWAGLQAAFSNWAVLYAGLCFRVGL